MVYGFLPTHAFNDSGSSTTFHFIKNILLSKISPPLLAAHAFNDSGLRPYLTSLPWAAHAFKYRNSQQPLNTTPPGKLSRDPTHLLFPINNSEQR